MFTTSMESGGNVHTAADLHPRRGVAGRRSAAAVSVLVLAVRPLLPVQLVLRIHRPQTLVSGEIRVGINFEWGFPC